MLFLDTATELRMTKRHIQQIARDVDQTRSAVVPHRREVPTQEGRIHFYPRVRRSVGVLLIRAGERMCGTPAAVFTTESPSPSGS